jgi:hypothetical protein
MRADCLFIGKGGLLLFTTQIHTDCYLNKLATANAKYSALFDRQAAIFLEHCGWVMDS